MIESKYECAIDDARSMPGFAITKLSVRVFVDVPRVWGNMWPGMWAMFTCFGKVQGVCTSDEEMSMAAMRLASSDVQPGCMARFLSASSASMAGSLQHFWW